MRLLALAALASCSPAPIPDAPSDARLEVPPFDRGDRIREVVCTTSYQSSEVGVWTTVWTTTPGGHPLRLDRDGYPPTVWRWRFGPANTPLHAQQLSMRADGTTHVAEERWYEHGRVIRLERAVTDEWTWDEQGRMLTYGGGIDGDWWFLRYTEAGHLAGIESDSSLHDAWQYDWSEDGRLLSERWRRGESWVETVLEWIEHDAEGRPLHGEGPGFTASWTYDADGLPIARQVGEQEDVWMRRGGRIVRHERDGVLLAEYEWDDAGRMTLAHRPDERFNRAQLETWSWDADGVLRENTRSYEDGSWWWEAHDGGCPRQHRDFWADALDVEPSGFALWQLHPPEPPR